MNFKPIRLSEWAAQVDADPAPQWIIRDFIAADNLVLVSGVPKFAQKTWLDIYLALVAATGSRTTEFVAERAVETLYIYREGARKATLNRFRKVCASHSLPKVETIHNLHFVHRGEWWLDEGAWVQATCDYIREHNIKLIFIDTLAKSMTGDENSSQDVGRAVRAAEVLRDSGATVVLVHHLRKAESSLTGGKEGYPDPDKDVRGSSALVGAYEMHLAVRAYQIEPHEVSWVLMVHGKEYEPVSYDYDWAINDVGAKLTLARLSDIPYIQCSDTTNFR